MATYSSYETVGAKEDISNVISNISPTKTPFQSMIGTDKVTQKLFQWQEDSLRAVTDNGAAEGADGTDITATPTVLRNNVTQILTETIKVSDGVDETDFYGRSKETAYQLGKSSAQLKRDLENTLVGLAGSLVSGSAGVARKMASYQAMINTTGTSNVVYTGAGPAALSETKVLAAAQLLFNAGADPSQLMITPTNAAVVADFVNNNDRSRVINDGGTTVVNAVDVYKTAFGSLKVSLNRFLKSGNTLVFDQENWVRMIFRNWQRKTLAKTGDATKIMLLGEFSLKHKNYSASSVIVEGTSGF